MCQKRWLRQLLVCTSSTSSTVEGGFRDRFCTGINRKNAQWLTGQISEKNTWEICHEQYISISLKHSNKKCFFPTCSAVCFVLFFVGYSCQILVRWTGNWQSFEELRGTEKEIGKSAYHEGSRQFSSYIGTFCSVYQYTLDLRHLTKIPITGCMKY